MVNLRVRARFQGLLGEFVADEVQVDGAVEGLRGYAAGLRDVIEAFPDFHWEIQELVVDGDVLAARLTNGGTHRGTFLEVPATGRRITTIELAMYHVRGGKIVASWGDLGQTVRLAVEAGDSLGAG